MYIIYVYIFIYNLFLYDVKAEKRPGEGRGRKELAEKRKGGEAIRYEGDYGQITFLKKNLIIMHEKMRVLIPLHSSETLHRSSNALSCHVYVQHLQGRVRLCFHS